MTLTFELKREIMRIREMYLTICAEWAENHFDIDVNRSTLHERMHRKTPFNIFDPIFF